MAEPVSVPQSGPIATAIWRAAPMLEVVDRAALGEPGSASWTRAIDERRAGDHPCLICGAQSFFALIVAPGPDSPPFERRWADLCPLHFQQLDAEGQGW